ncbi:Os09g0568100 [Oryza sativa Japonica Group]|uniref:Os09g0568100 protein n=1 Tax=Oryza sativa subsp. japonica TaxID=39947 RepID=A0A0P0XR11_ORYSJ|nr:hypothetical protein EE612_049558 [Oryza sativa]BAT09486.1 Os09g0568100 [Oryza sativa Japonica Group]
MSLAPPPQLRAFRRDGDAPLFFAAGESSRATSRSRCGRNLVSVSYGGFARACCLFSAAGSRSRSKQLGKQWKMPWGGRRRGFQNWVCELKEGSKDCLLQPVVEDGLEEVVGSGGSAVEVSGMLQNKLFLRSSVLSPRFS